MKIALSPSLTNYQHSPSGAGHLTGAVSSNKMPNTSLPAGTPTKLTRRRSRRAAPMKRTSSTASIMDSVMSSQTPSDHDSQAPAEQIAINPSSSISSTILLTPRRGRRVGKVDMGWGSPIVDEFDEYLNVPHTLPKAKAKQDVLIDVSSPAKRKASTAFAPELQTAHRSLVDTAGWASAAMLSTVPLTEHELRSSPGFSPRDVRSPTVASMGEARDILAAFTSPLIPQDPRLVPMDVQGLGRVAVHRDFTQQIFEHGPVSGLTAPRRYSSNGLLRGSESENSSGRSDADSSTDPTSVGTPCPSGASPSFSLSSHFPASEPPSPAKRSDVRSPQYMAAEAQRALISLMNGSHSTETALSAETLSWRPRLGGMDASGKKLPSLDWPDSPYGPWSAAGTLMNELKQKRKEGLERWLETDAEDDLEAQLSMPAYQHHPMVAKALLDRARKRQQVVIATIPATASPMKRGKRLSTVVTPIKRRGRKSKVPAVSVTSARKSVATGASLRSSGAANLGCKCGIEDLAIYMVQCDDCKHWLHLPCVGIKQASDLDEEWYCDTCCDAAIAEHLSPASSHPTSYADLATPEGLQELLSGQEPVFTLPSGTPIHRHGVAVSSSIALAPSPTLLSVGEPSGRSTTKRQGLGRSRAERVGWRINEPGSPLARKSTTGSSGVRPTVPETSTKATTDFIESNSALLAGFARSDWEPVRAAGGNKSLLDRPMTPSPRLACMSTPSRHASGRKVSNSGPLSLGFVDEEPDHVDVFSTPSRLASGGTWTYRSGQGQHPGSLTPSRSGNRHHRIESFSGGMLTPGRDFLSGAFVTEPSTGMPSLIYSSGYDHGLEEHVGASDGHYSNSRAWQLQSPTSATRAVRARQLSGFGAPWLSSQLKTPELQPRQPNTSCVRGQVDSSDDVPPSSSPFPRTPTFDFGSPKFMHHYSGAHGHERHPSHLGNGLPTGGSSARLHKVMAGESVHRHSHLGDRSTSGSSGNSAHKNRQVSSEVALGLGIGLDLDDVLDWS